jgi:hypothetical protein
MERQIIGAVAGFLIPLAAFRLAELFRRKDKRLPIVRQG